MFIGSVRRGDVWDNHGGSSLRIRLVMRETWIPAFAGMTGEAGMTISGSGDVWDNHGGDVPTGTGSGAGGRKAGIWITRQPTDARAIITTTRLSIPSISFNYLRLILLNIKY